MTSECELLRRYAEGGDEAAFAEVVRGHADMVYSTALRLVARDAHLAEDVTQKVFTDLARKAGALTHCANLAGWLYDSTRFAAMKTIRTEQKYRRHELESHAMHDESTGQEILWEQLWPTLDAAMHRLSKSERDAVVLRFFKGKSHREVGDVCGLNEDAARKRVERALEKLRVYFSRAGVTTTTALLATAMATNAVQAAPVGLAATWSGIAVAGPVGTGGFSHALGKLLYMTTKTKIAIACAAVIIAATFDTGLTLGRHEAAAKPTASIQAPAKSLASSSGDIAKAKSMLAKILSAPKSINRTNELLSFIASLDTETVKNLFIELEKSPLHKENQSALDTLLERWTELDPKSIFAWAQSVANSPKRSLDLMNIFDSWSARDPRAALAAISQLPDVDFSSQLRILLMSRIADGTRDPAALNVYNSLRGSDLRSLLQSKILANMASQDPQAALAALRSFPTGQQAALYGTVFKAWANQDPAAAAANALNLPPSSVRNKLLNNIADAWAQQDSSAALAWAASLPTGSAREDAITSAVQAMSKQDPQAAIDYVANLPNTQSRELLLVGIGTNWARLDPASAFAWLNNTTLLDKNYFTDGIRQSVIQTAVESQATWDTATANAYLAKLDVESSGVALATHFEIATAWAMQDAPAAFNWALSLPSNDRGNASIRNDSMVNVLETWAASDPAAAAAYIQNLSSDPAFSQLADQVANSWGKADPQAALAWAAALPEGDARDASLATAFTQLANGNPKAALTWAENLPEGDARNTALNQAVTQFAKYDPQGAITWAETQPEGDARNSAISQAVTRIADDNDPQSALNYAQQLSGDSRDKATAYAITRWADLQPTQSAEAANSLAMLPEGQALDNATSNVARNWLNQDPAAATQWISALPAGSARDGAVVRLAMSLASANKDPQSAFNWIVSIGNESTRNTQAINFLRSVWYPMNHAATAAAAQSYMNAPGVGSAEQATLQQIVDKAAAQQ